MLLRSIFFLLVTMSRGQVPPVRPGGLGVAPGPNLTEFEHHADVLALAKSQNKFARDLYLHIIKGSDQNVFFSPLSIMTALGMTRFGAKELTAEQMDGVMNIPENIDVMANAFKDLIADYKKEASEYELKTSNKAYISNVLSVESNFSGVLTDVFQSSVQAVDFKDHEKVRLEINSAVTDDTNGRINDLIQPGLLSNMTRMVLVNAMYFKGFWDTPFDSELTKNEPFWVTPDQSVDVPMMHTNRYFRMAPLRDLDAMLLAMDYKGGRMSMVIVLPNKKDGLAGLESHLTDADLSTLDRKTASVKLDVAIPKFKLELGMQLNEILKKMGIEDLFSEVKCDLSGITSTKDLFVSAVVHKAFLEVNEEGSEAAAATVIAVTRMALIRNPEAFIANHPFLFFIRDRHSDMILFSGRYIRPN